MRTQRGGLFVGFIAGLLVGLALALGVALYVTKVPVPFIDKVPQRTADQDAAEAERNRKWNPNEALASKVPVRPAGASASGAAQAASAPAGLPPVSADAGGTASLPAVATVPAGQGPAVAAARNPGGADTSARPGGEPFVYFVQIGAYGRNEDAEQQRARLAMAGMTAKVTEREQSGRTVYRVRLGPYEGRDSAEAVKQQATDGGFADAVLVRVQR
jgi:cell division protein FtsN